MPTYEYACGECGHQYDQFQSIKAEPLKVCPKCGKRRLKRLIGTGGGVIFKGSGFYQTDYRSDSYKKAAEAETKSATPDKSESSTDKATGNDKAAAAPAVKPATESAGTKKGKKSAGKAE
jgi:putative FmdB family regulatory protein